MYAQNLKFAFPNRCGQLNRYLLYCSNTIPGYVVCIICLVGVWHYLSIVQVLKKTWGGSNNQHLITRNFVGERFCGIPTICDIISSTNSWCAERGRKFHP